MSEKLLYSAKDLKRITGLSTPNVYKLLHDPDMPVVKVGHRLFMNRDLFHKKLEEMSTQRPKVETVEIK